MKKTTLGLLMVLLGVSGVWARQINSDEAMSVASEFMNSSELKTATTKNTSLSRIKAPGINSESTSSSYYIFNRGENEGFVIISGDDRAPKILGYSDKGTFDGDNLPSQLKDMMEEWSKQIEQLPESASRHASWSNTAKTRAGEGILMETAEWGQGYPFNAYCPVIEGEQAPAGCVATAMAIAMKYHNWPDYTRGDVQTDYFYPELEFDFSNYSIDWKVLDDKNDPKFAEEVAKLIFGAGVCNSMYYGAYESSAEVWPVGHKMIELYTYAKGCQYIERHKYSDAEWESLLKKQLEEVGPVIYRGDGNVGHCFIVDGYDSTGMYHINWGWDGLLNGYYTIDLSDIEGNFFPNNHGMIIDLRPDKERKEYSKAFIPNIQEYQSQEWNFFEPDIKQGERNIVLIPTITQNCFNGYYGLAVVDNDDNIKEIFYSTPANAGIRYACPYPGVYYGNTLQGDKGILFPHLKEGERYQLVTMDATYETNGEENPGFWTWTPSSPSDNPEDWKIVLGGIDYPSYFYGSGNKSEVSEVTIHVAENLPMFMDAYKQYSSSDPIMIRQLKWEALGENYFIPKKGVSFQVVGRDKDGEPQETLITNSDYDGTTNVYSMTLTMNQDYFDIYVNYEPDLDTRKDSGYDAEEIVTENGIVYKIDGNEATVIGYDNIPEDVTIPYEINTSIGSLPVTSVAGDAFLHAPVKHISFDRGNLLMYELAFAGMEKLESISIDNEDFHPQVRWGVPFLKSQFKYLYTYGCPDPWEMQNLLDIKPWVSEWDYWDTSKPFDTAVSGHHDVTIYMSNPIPNPEAGYYQLIRMLDYLNEVKNVYHLEDVISSVTLPGVGESSSVLAEIKNYDVPVVQMWTYAIDHRHNSFKIQPEIEEIKILSVLVNGEAVTPGEDYIYQVHSTKDMEVTVNYILNDYQKMTTVYDTAYNIALPSQNLSTSVSVESITLTPESWSGEEGESFMIEATVMPEDATDKSLVWESSDESVATVDGEGNVSVLKEGNCVIKATAADGSGVSAECIITSVAGVDEIFSAEDSFDVYGLNGVLVKKNADRESLKYLASGIYLLRQGGKMKKLVIR